MTSGYTRDPQSGMWYHPKDGGIWFDPQTLKYYSVRRSAWAGSESGPWPDSPANASGTGSRSAVPFASAFRPGRPGAANCVGAEASLAQDTLRSEFLLRAYMRLPVVERARFLVLIGEVEEEFDEEFASFVNAAPVQDQKRFDAWVKANAELLKQKLETLARSKAKRGANAGTIRGRRR